MPQLVTKTISRNNVPVFLRSTKRYNEIVIPEEYYVDTLEMKTIDDFKKLYETCKYWQPANWPKELINFMMLHTKQEKEFSQLISLELFKTVLGDDFKAFNFICRFYRLYSNPDDKKPDLGKCLSKLDVDTFTKVMKFGLFPGIPLPYRKKFYNMCAENNNFGLLKHIFTNQLLTEYYGQSAYIICYKWHVDDTITFACEHGNLEMVKFLLENGFEFHNVALSQAAMNGHLNVIKFIFENRNNSSYKTFTKKQFTWCIYTCQQAGIGGHLDVLKYAHQNGAIIDTTCDTFTVDWIAVGGDYDCMKYILDLNDEKINKSVGPQTFCLASANGNYRILELLHERFGPLWDENTTKYAEINGYEDCLRYALLNGCSYYREIKKDVSQKKKKYDLRQWYNQLQKVCEHHMMHFDTLRTGLEFIGRRGIYKDIPKCK